MPNVYIEPQPKGRPEGSHIDDYVVEDHADHVLATFKTQHEAIDWAKKNGHTPHVARVRHLNDKKKADHWRATWPSTSCAAFCRPGLCVRVASSDEQLVRRGDRRSMPTAA
jgi:hypothetical protein